MKVVYLAHPVGAETTAETHENLRKAKAWAFWAAHQGVSPVAPYIPLVEAFLAAGIPESEGRELGMRCDLAVLARCDEVWMCGPIVSEGMQAEWDRAEELRIPVWCVPQVVP